MHACHHSSGGQRTTLVVGPQLTPPLRRVPLLAFHGMCHASSSGASAFVSHLPGEMQRLQRFVLCALFFPRVLRILTLSGVFLSCRASHMELWSWGVFLSPSFGTRVLRGPRLRVHPFPASGSSLLCSHLQHSSTELSPQLPFLLSDIWDKDSWSSRLWTQYVLRISLNWSSCLHLPNSGSIGVHCLPCLQELLLI